jgi:hypothetical protein
MKEMLSLSGFGFNSKTKCLTATEEVWAAYLAVSIYSFLSFLHLPLTLV